MHARGRRRSIHSDAAQAARCDAFGPRFRRHQPCGYAQSLDVRADDSVQARVEAVHRRCGYLDVLINNARYEQAGAQEELSPQAGPHQSLAVMAGATS